MFCHQFERTVVTQKACTLEFVICEVRLCLLGCVSLPPLTLQGLYLTTNGDPPLLTRAKIVLIVRN